MSVLCCYLHFTIPQKIYPVKKAVFYRNDKIFSFSCGYSLEFRRVLGLYAEPDLHWWKHISAE